MTIVGIVVLIVVLGLIYWGLSYIVPQPFLRIILFLFVAICILALIDFILGMPGVSGSLGHSNILRRTP